MLAVMGAGGVGDRLINMLGEAGDEDNPEPEGIRAGICQPAAARDAAPAVAERGTTDGEHGSLPRDARGAGPAVDTVAVLALITWLAGLFVKSELDSCETGVEIGAAGAFAGTGGSSSTTGDVGVGIPGVISGAGAGNNGLDEGGGVGARGDNATVAAAVVELLLSVARVGLAELVGGGFGELLAVAADLTELADWNLLR